MIETRCLYSSPDFLVRKYKDGAVMFLRNGHKEVKTTNRIAKMCSMKKRGGLRQEGNVLYYELEELR